MRVIMKILQLFLTVILSERCYCEFYSTSDGLRTLLATQSDAVVSLEHAVRELDTLMYDVTKILSILKEHDAEASKDAEKYIGNPINSFTLINRLRRDFDRLADESYHTLGKMKQALRKKERLDYPNDDDTTGAAVALVRLIETYELNHRNISEGRIFDVQSLPMSSNDCFTFAQELLKAKDYEYAEIWLEESIKKFDDKSTYTLADVYLGLAECETKKGNLKHALFWYYHVLDISPSNAVALEKKSEVLNMRASNGGKWDKEPEPEAHHAEPIELFENTSVSYETLCREEFIPHPDVYNRLKCFYKHGRHPFLKIAPFKFEEVHPNVSLYVVHEVISDDEIEWIKNMSRPKFFRAMIFNDEEKRGEVASYRTAQTAWLSQRSNKEVAKLYRRVQHFTDLKTSEQAEMLQTGIYGIGGHYGLHQDFFNNKEILNNRIATAMFYLSDVEMGGGTTFPHLGVTVPPKKGSAVYWFNLHPSGEFNVEALHGACPVLLGAKWVANVWIRSMGQHEMFPCTLEFQDNDGKTDKQIKYPIKRKDYYKI